MAPRDYIIHPSAYDLERVIAEHDAVVIATAGQHLERPASLAAALPPPVGEAPQVRHDDARLAGQHRGLMRAAPVAR